MKSEFVFTILKFLIVPGVESQVEIMLLCKFMHILLQLIVARNKGLPGMGITDAIKTQVGAVAKTHRFDWRPWETLRPPVTRTYMMLSKFPHGETNEGGTEGRTDKAILGVG